MVSKAMIIGGPTKNIRMATIATVVITPTSGDITSAVALAVFIN